MRLIEASPLAGFLIYSRLIEPSISIAWLGPFLAGSVLGGLSTAWQVHKRTPLNRLFVGINLYLVSGAAGLLFQVSWLNQIYSQLQASGMLAAIILVGVITILFSRKGFIGVEYRERIKAVIISLLLLLGAVMAFLISFYFSSHPGGNRLLSELVPFVLLFSLQGLLKSKFPA